MERITKLSRFEGIANSCKIIILSLLIVLTIVFLILCRQNRECSAATAKLVSLHEQLNQLCLSSVPPRELSSTFRRFKSNFASTTQFLTNLPENRFRIITASKADIELISQVWDSASTAERHKMLSGVLHSIQEAIDADQLALLRNQEANSIRLLQTSIVLGLLSIAFASLGPAEAITTKSHLELVSSALEPIPSPAAALNQQLHFIFSNAAFCSLTGITRTALEGTSLEALVLDPTIQEPIAHGNTTEGNRTTVNCKVRIPKNKGYRTCRLTIKQLTMQNDLIAIANLADISAEITAASLRRDVLAIAGHELRAPLTSIPALLRLVLCDEQNQFTNDELENLITADSHLRTLCALTGSLLEIVANELNSVSGISVSSVSLRALIQQCVDQVKMPKGEYILTASVNVPDAFLWIDKPKILKAIGDILEYLASTTNGNSDLFVTGSFADNATSLQFTIKPLSAQMVQNEKEERVRLLFSNLILQSHGGQMHISSTSDGSERTITIELPSKLSAQRLAGGASDA